MTFKNECIQTLTLSDPKQLIIQLWRRRLVCPRPQKKKKNCYDFRFYGLIFLFIIEVVQKNLNLDHHIPIQFMIGKHRGFIALMKKKIPGLIAVHCVIHRQHLVTHNLSAKLHNQWWIFKIVGLRQNSNKGPRKIDVAINNCDQTMLLGRL